MWNYLGTRKLFGGSSHHCCRREGRSLQQLRRALSQLPQRSSFGFEKCRYRKGAVEVCPQLSREGAALVRLRKTVRIEMVSVQGVLFLMFNPGSGGKNGRELSLLQDIQALGQKGLHIHGLVNQTQDAPTKGDPGGGTDSTVSYANDTHLLGGFSVGRVSALPIRLRLLRKSQIKAV